MRSDSELSDLIDLIESDSDDNTKRASPNPTNTTRTESTADPGDNGSVFNAPKNLTVPLIGSQLRSSSKRGRQATLSLSIVTVAFYIKL